MTHPTPRKPPGRPRVDASDTSVGVYVTVPSRLYDRSYRAARAARQTVNDWIRDRLRDAVKYEKSAG